MKIPTACLVMALALPVAADEGMWLFNQFPKDQVEKAYGFGVSSEFLDHLRLASLRIGGSSGSFVSAKGLILTTRETAANCIAKVATPEHDYVKEGFSAAESARELACPGMEASVLVALEDVTGQIKEPPKETASKGAKNAAAEKAADTLARRNAAAAKLEKACSEKTGNTCSVVKLSSGERYDLYQYKKYSDLRLVFAPELAVAFFGGAAATFTYQRYQMDISFLRAYENGRPAATPQFLQWSAEGAKDADLLFVAGNPDATSRLDTAAQLTFYRDTSLPLATQRLAARINTLTNFVPKTPESRRIAEAELSGLGMEYKHTAALLIGLRDERLLIRKTNFERRLRNAVQHDPKFGTDGGKVWDEVAEAYKNWTPFERAFQILERPAGEGSALFRLARQVYRASQERAKPNEQRLAEYRDHALPSLERSLESAEAIDDDLEVVLMTAYLTDVRALGERELPLKTIFGNKTPQQLAEECVHETKLKDPAERKRLAGDKAGAAQSEDPMMRLVRLLEDPARKLLKKHQDTIESLEASSAERIAQYRFRIWGPADYPDATSTPRVTFGVVKPYRDRTEADVTFATTFGGLYHWAGTQEAVKLPQRWVDAKTRLDLIVPFNFVSTCDISAGNSGSPTVNRKGELVGMVFDANLDALASTYMYTDELARSVHVASQGIVEALRTVYGAASLLKELGVSATGKAASE